ncbi:SIS domain-containing protein [Neobacillus muris]|uniref:SIS domain-containing protein n=1 Tax=Neobacillus muris TaxID=2941334 RepID=UPI00203A7176|nr:SIS domain-containing protein [Neobacillus muris]
MFNFDVERFLKIQNGAVSLKNDMNKVIDSLFEKGISSLFFIGTGGAAILMKPAEFIMKNHSTLPTFAEISSEFMLTSHKFFDEKSLVVLPSLSGTTEETVKAAEFVKQKGATTISLVGYADTPLAKATDYSFVNYAADDTSCESFYLQSYLIAFRLMHLRNEFPQYEKVVSELVKVPEALLGVKEAVENRAEDFAAKIKDIPYHILVGSGNSWAETYYYGMCILEEMQWIKTRPVHASDFFHGTLELVEKGVSVLLFKGEDETRPLTDRVQNFAEVYTDQLEIFDTKDYELPGISEEVRSYLSPVVLATLLERVSCHLEKERNHPLTTRRYYRRVKY